MKCPLRSGIGWTFWPTWPSEGSKVSWVSSIYPHPRLKGEKNHKTDFIVSPLHSEKAFAFVNSEREKRKKTQKGQTQHLPQSQRGP